MLTLSTQWIGPDDLLPDHKDIEIKDTVWYRHTLNDTPEIAEINQKNTLKLIQLNPEKKNLTWQEW
jgi:hypothetical protein